MYDYEEVIEEESEIPPGEPEPDTGDEFLQAKSFLQKCSSMSGDNLYDHLSDVLNNILADRPENVIDFFEEYSTRIKERRFRPNTDHFEDIYVTPGRYELAKRLMPLLRPMPHDIPIDPEYEYLADMSRNDMLQLCYFFEQAGLGLPRNEMFYILLSMRQLIRVEPIESIRFWGKIHGLYKNYIVVETELKEEEIIKRTNLFNENMEQLLATQTLKPEDDLEKAMENVAKTKEDEERGEAKLPRILPPVPIIRHEEIPEAPSESPGVGVNKKVFYVCNEPGESWIQLPDATPQQIRVSRQIKKAFTGFLNQPIITYPNFPGQEINYLRVQIARISAATQISPLGFYTFKDEGGEEEEEEAEDEEEGEGAMKTTYKENSRYDPIPIRDLIDGSMSFWVHHTLHILPQGRTSWWNPYPSVEEEMGEEMGEEEEKGKSPSLEPETGPPLLTPCSEDAAMETVPAWSARSSSRILQDYAVAIVRSHLWPGAYCFSNQGKIFQNVYLGYGHKYLSNNFSPVPLPPVEQDYPLGPEIMEIDDPTGAQEEQWRIDHLPKPKPVIEEAEGEEEAEEEED